MQSARKPLAIIAVALIALSTFAAFPARSFADQIPVGSLQTRDAIPPGGHACVQPAVGDITTYVYDGHLDSFDFTISDQAYVALAGTVGEGGVSFQYMTRRILPDGRLRVHVDLDPTYADQPIPASVVLLSAVSGQPVCLTTVDFTIPATVQAIPSHQVSTGDAGNSVDNPVSNSEGSTGNGIATAPTSTVGTIAPEDGMNSKGICTEHNSQKIWYVIIAIYLVLAALVALAEPPLASKHPGIPTAFILVPFIVLVIFWFLTPLCRGAGWIPLVLLLIAAAAMIAAFRNRPFVPPPLLLPNRAKGQKLLKDGQTKTIELPEKTGEVKKS